MPVVIEEISAEVAPPKQQAEEDVSHPQESPQVDIPALLRRLEQRRNRQVVD